MPQKNVIKNSGLFTFTNELNLPEGAMTKADDVIIDKTDIVESRRGINLYGETFGTSSDRAKQLLQYKNELLLHYSDKLSYDDGSGNFTDFSGTYSELEDGLRIKYIESNGNLFFTTNEGVRKISATSSSEFTNAADYVTLAGAPRGLNMSGTLTADSTWFLEDYVVAYRVLWGYKDLNNNLILGAPSEIFFISNPSGSGKGAVELEFTIPQELLANDNYFYQVYRSPIVAGVGSIPEDELQFVMEDFPTSTDQSNGYVTVADVVNEDFRSSGDFLYTNINSGSGIAQSNIRPPVAKDITVYKNMTFYANTRTNHQLQINLLATDDLSTTLTEYYIGDASGYETYYFRATEDIANWEVYLDKTSPTPSQQIDNTARSFVRVINRKSTKVRAYYISGIGDLPGQILLEKRNNADVNFYIGTNDADYGKDWSPSIPVVTPTTPFISTLGSDNEQHGNRIYYSKVNQPEAVPSVNYIDVGAKNQDILRIVALRDSLFILKTDSIYRLTGSSVQNFVVSLFDSSSPLIAADSVQVLNNQVYMLSDQGVASLSEAGSPLILSRNIENLVLQPTSFNFPDFEKKTFGISYESDRAYMLFMPTETNDATATQCFRFNTFTGTWTRWVVSKSCGLVKQADDKLYLGAVDTNQIEQERKNFSRTDYCDRQYDKNLAPTSIDDVVIKLPDLNNVNEYDVLYQAQYVTVKRFNRLLKRLDNDPFLDDTDYFSSLEAVGGINLMTRLESLVLKLNIDDVTTTYSTPSGNNGATDIRDDFNVMIGEVNSSSGVFYDNYTQYTEAVEFEAVISSIEQNSKEVTLHATFPFLISDVTIFNSIKPSIEWSPDTIGSASSLKQIYESTLMFDQYNFTFGEISFRSDLSEHLETVVFEAEGNGAFGSQVYGEKVYGGLGNQRPFRTYVPRNKQRCRFILIGFTHIAGREIFRLNGYSLAFNADTSERAYRG